MRQQNRERRDGPRVVTLRPQQFADHCRRLDGMVRRDFGDWDLVVGIAEGARYMLPWFIGDGTAAVSVRLSRTSSSAKKGLLSGLLSKMPRRVCDWLRVAESKVYSCLDSIGGEAEVNQELPSQPMEQLRAFMALWQRARADKESRAAEVPRVLIVDDAADSGSSLRKVRGMVAELLPDARIATCVLAATRTPGSSAADYALYRDGTLLRFPWAPDYHPLEGEEVLSGMEWRDAAGDMKEAVICDLDGTLVRTNSFSRFVAWLPLKVPLLAPKLLGIVGSRKLRRISHAEAKQRILALIPGELKDYEIDGWAKSLLAKYGRQWLREFLEGCRKEGSPVVLATAAPAIYASQVALDLKTPYYVATGKGERECSGEEKLDRVRTLLDSLDARPGLFFTDHADDLPLARWVALAGGGVIWCL